MTFYVRVPAAPPPPEKQSTAICYLDVKDEQGNSISEAKVGETVKIECYLFVPSPLGCVGGTGINGKTVYFYWKDTQIGSAITKKGGVNNWDGYAEFEWTIPAGSEGKDVITAEFRGDEEYEASSATKSFEVQPVTGAYWVGIKTKPGWTVELYRCFIPLGCPYAIISTFGSPEYGWELIDSRVAPEDGKVMFTDLDVNTDYGIVVWDEEGKEVRELKITEEEQFNKWYTIEAPAVDIIAMVAQFLGIEYEQAKWLCIGVGVLFFLGFVKWLLS